MWLRQNRNDLARGYFSCAAAYETPNRNGNEGMDTLETIPDAVPAELTEPPIEEQLAWHTLWPESHKLYGHGNEIFSLCCDHEGKLVASSCKVSSAIPIAVGTFLPVQTILFLHLRFLLLVLSLNKYHKSHVQISILVIPKG